jgi:hypothetical protein
MLHDRSRHLGCRFARRDMTQIFIVLYQIHPLLPAVYLLVFAAGVFAPAIYCLVRNIPYSLGIIWEKSKEGDLFARAVIAVYSTFALLSSVCLILVLCN